MYIILYIIDISPLPVRITYTSAICMKFRLNRPVREYFSYFTPKKAILLPIGNKIRKNTIYIKIMLDFFLKICYTPLSIKD